LSMQSDTNSSSVRQETGHRVTSGQVAALPLYLLILVLVLLVGAYFEYLVWMVGRWWRSEYYSHGFLIPLISGYLVYRQRQQLATLPREGHTWGLVIVGASLLLYLWGVAIPAHFIQGFAFVGTLWGLAWWLGGWPLARAVAFPAAFLLFMVPLARLLVELFAQPLQLHSALLAGAVSQFIGMDVTIEGTSLQIPGYTFEVAVPCSGLKSTIAMSALAALLAYLAAAPIWRKLLLFALSVPVALLANAVRIWVTLVLGGSLGPKAAEGFFHSLSGILVFLLGLGGLLLVGRLLGCHQMREDI